MLTKYVRYKTTVLNMFLLKAERHKQTSWELMMPDDINCTISFIKNIPPSRKKYSSRNI